jgi:hypothetical protein
MKYNLDELAKNVALAKDKVEKLKEESQRLKTLRQTAVEETKKNWPQYQAMFDAAISKLNATLKDSGILLSVVYTEGGDGKKLMMSIFKTITVKCTFDHADKPKQMVVFVDDEGVLQVDVYGKGMKPAFDGVETRFVLKRAETTHFEDLLSALVQETIA